MATEATTSEADEIADLKGLFGKEDAPAASEDPLFDIFKEFALFGKKGQTEAGKTQDGLDAWKPTASGTDGANPSKELPAHQQGVGLEGKQFMKLCKECKLIDKKFTNTDVDLTFAKFKGVGEKNKHLWYDQFLSALEAVASKKGSTIDKVKSQIVNSGGPASSGTKAKNDGITAKMTDTSQYTGAHKERFDENGKGKGLDGRDRIAKGVGTANTGATINRDETADVRGVVKEKGGARPPTPKPRGVCRRPIARLLRHGRDRARCAACERFVRRGACPLASRCAAG